MLEKNNFLSEAERQFYEKYIQWGTDFSYNVIKADYENVPYDEIGHVFRTGYFKSFTGSVDMGCAIGRSCSAYEILCFYISQKKSFDNEFITTMAGLTEEGDFQISHDIVEETLAFKVSDKEDMPYYQSAYFLAKSKLSLMGGLFIVNAILFLNGLQPIIVPTDRVPELRSLCAEGKNLKKIALFLKQFGEDCSADPQKASTQLV